MPGQPRTIYVQMIAQRHPIGQPASAKLISPIEISWLTSPDGHVHIIVMVMIIIVMVMIIIVMVMIIVIIIVTSIISGKTAITAAAIITAGLHRPLFLLALFRPFRVSR